ncbi:MAG TPA: CBS domain-containing protein [Chromatiales bacterium]|nr:CBS domain-containing protein [Chromatiales bacterium]
MKTIGQVLDKKGHDVLAIGPDASVYDAIKIMSENNVGSLMVMQGDDVVGTVTERDYSRKIALEGRSSRETTVGEIMSSPVIFVRPEQTVEDGMALVTEKRVRHLPVMKDGKLVGLVSIGDLVKAIIDDQKFMIEQLVNYISS